MVKKLTTQLEKKRKSKKAEKVVTVKPVKNAKAKKKTLSTKIREKQITEQEQARMMREMNSGEEGCSSKLKAPKLSKKELEVKEKTPSHKVRHQKITEKEQSSLLEEMNLEEQLSGKLKITRTAQKISGKDRKRLHPRVRKTRVSAREKSSMVGSVESSESYSKKLKAPKLSRKELKKEKKNKPAHKVRHRAITEFEQAQLVEGLNFEEKLRLPKSKHRISRKTKQTAKKATEARRKVSKLREVELGILDKTKARNRKGSHRQVKNVDFESTDDLIRDQKAKVAKDSRKRSKSYSKTKTKAGAKKGTPSPTRTKLEEANLHKFQERRRASEAKKVKKAKPKKKKKKLREIDLSSQNKKQTISRRKKSKYDALIVQKSHLVGELDELKEFRGGYLKKLDKRIRLIQQKAIQTELKVNQCFFQKADISIDGVPLQVPEKISQEVSDGVPFTFSPFLEKKEFSRGTTQETMSWCDTLKKVKGAIWPRSFSPKKRELKKNRELYLPPEAIYFGEDQKQFKRAGLYIPFKFLSRTDHLVEIVVNRYLTQRNRAERLSFEKNYFQELKRNESRKQKTIQNNLGKKHWVEDYTEEPFYKQKLKSALISLKVIPTPLVHWARRNQKVMKQLYSNVQFMKFPWSQCELKPFKYQSQKVIPLAPTFTDQEGSVLYEKPQIPPYWKTIRDKAQYASSSLYNEFLENFGEYDLLNYGKDNWEMVKTLRDRYFENHLSNEELSFQANQEIAPELNRMMKLLNEQPFLVFPLGASPAMYSILPELDGISEELSRHKITPDKKKKVSVKDVHIRSLKGIPDNILSDTENSLSFSSEACLGIEKKEFTKLKKFRDFEVEEYSKSCYSRFGQSMLLNCSRTKQMKELQKFKRRLPIWTFINELFLLDNSGLNPEGSLPFFEKAVLKEDYKRGSFSHSLMYWDREFQKTHRLGSSVRNIKNRSTLIEKLNELNLKLS